MPGNCEVFVIFPIFDHFGAIRKPDFGRSKKIIFSLILTFYLIKLQTELKNLYHSSHNIALSKSTIFAKKRWFFAKKCWHQQN